MTVNALDNSCTNRSPCLSCERKNDDKSECLSGCKQIAAYQAGQSYVNIPHFIKSETAASKTTQKVFPVKSPTPKPESWAKTLLKNQKQAEKLAKPAKIALPKVVAVPVKQEVKEVSGAEKCVICGKPETKENPFRSGRGMCISPCYGAWYHGRVEYPGIGKFTKMGSEELRIARGHKYQECLIEGCHEPGRFRGLCSRGGGHYKAWYDGKIEHPKLGIFQPKYKKVSMDKTEKKIVVGELEKRKIIIDLSDYEALHTKLKQEADKSLVSIEHKIISLIAEKMQKCKKGKIIIT